VERIGLEVGKKDVLSTDPVADADARVVEVEIRLRDSEPAAALTNLRVEVVLEP
jgi:HlyD family secretion protein